MPNTGSWIFLASAAFVVYVMAGYPMLVHILARLRRRPVRRDATARTVSIVIAVRNGASFIAQKLDCVLALDYPRDLLQVIVVSDGSDDGTDEIVRTYRSGEVQLVRIDPAGKSAALNAGIAHASGEILFFTDVRQYLAPDSLRRLVERFADPDCGVVSGELIIRQGRSGEENSIGMYWRYEKWIRKSLSAIGYVPGATGAIYAMRRSLARPLPPHTLCDDMYLPLAAHLQRGCRIVFEDRARAFDDPARLDVEFRRKVRTLAGVYQVACNLPRLLDPRTPVFLHFISHKIGRLLLPFAMVSLFASSLALPHPAAIAAAGSQALFYIFAALDPWVPEGAFLKRLTSPARSFTVLLIAALAAASILFRPAESFWKPTRIDHTIPSAGRTHA